MTPVPDWMHLFDERQRKQILWARAYDTDEFRHGDNGHNDKLIIAKMARLIDGLDAKYKSATKLGYNP